MPYYDYKCLKCNNTFEIEKGMNEVPEDLNCPKCGSSKTKRVFNKIRIGKSESELLNDFGTSGSSCNTCTDGVCSSCSVKKV